MQGIPDQTPAANAGVNDAIAQAKRQLERMIDLTPQMMLLVDSKGTLIRCNRSLIELMEYEDFDEVLGRRLQELFPSDDPAGIQSLLDSRTGYAVQDVRALTRGGERRELRFSLINTGRDEAFRVVIVEDVTGANDRAVQVARSHKRDAVKALAGALMHRLNQPLTVIMVKAAMININIEKGAARPDEIKAALKEIMDLTMTMSEMLRKVEDARDYATEPYPGGGDILSLDC